MSTETTEVEQALLDQENADLERLQDDYDTDSGTAQRTIQEVVSMKLAGMSNQAIADHKGLKVHVVKKIVKDTVRSAAQEITDDLQAVMHLRMEQMLMVVWKDAVGAKDLDTKLRAQDQVLKIMAQQADLWGVGGTKTTTSEGGTHITTNNTVILAEGTSPEYVNALRSSAGEARAIQPGQVVDAEVLPEDLRE